MDLDSCLCAECIEGNGRLRHLKWFLKGEAKMCVKGHFSTNLNEANLPARMTLKSHYGNEQNIARSVRIKLDKWPKISHKDGQGL